MSISTNTEQRTRRLQSARVALALAFTVTVIAIGWRVPDASVATVDFDLADTSVLAESEAGTMAGNEKHIAPTLSSIRHRLEMFSRSGDARQLRFAEFELARWLERGEQRAEALLLKARIQQSSHEFARAAETLEQALRYAPDSIEGWLLYADVKRRAGDVTGSRRACMQLALTGDATLAQYCALQIALVSGQDTRAYRLSRNLLEVTPGLDAGTRAWALAVSADAAFAAGNTPQAVSIYEEVYQSGHSSLASRLALADMLLRDKRPLDAIAVLDGDADRLAAKVRLAAANVQLGTAVEESVWRSLDKVHSTLTPATTDPLLLHDRALLELDVRNSADKALDFALANWSAQKGLADLQLLRRAARAAGDTSVLDGLQRWQSKIREGHTL